MTFKTEVAGTKKRSVLGTGRSGAVGICITVIMIAALLASRSSPVQNLFRSTDKVAVLAYESKNLLHRPTVGRLIGFPHAPYAKFRGTEKTSIEWLKFSGTAGAVLEQSGAGSGERDRHARAIALLMVDQTAEAVSVMAALVEIQPKEARYWSDFAAIRLQESDERQDPIAAIEALANADRALELHPALAEAKYNRALALRLLGLDRQATRAFHQYLLADDESGWTREARARIANTSKGREADWTSAQDRLKACASYGDGACVRSIVERFPQEARTWAEGQYLAEWAEAFQTSGGGLNHLQLARMIGDALAEKFGEGLLKDAVKAIERALETRNSSAARVLASAHLNYRTARVAYSRRKVSDATTGFDAARGGFARSRSPMSFHCDYYSALADFDLHQSQRSLRALTSLQQRLPDRYAALSANVWWGTGIVLGSMGALNDQLHANQQALDIFQRLTEKGHVIRLRNINAGVLTILGRDADAWHIRREALRAASVANDEALFEFAVTEAAHAEVLEKRWANARSLFRLSLESPAHTRNPRRHIDVLMWSALIGHRLGYDVQRDLVGARRVLEGISEPSLQKDARGDLAFTEAIVVSRRDPERALRLFGSSLAAAEQSERTAWVPEMLLERSRLLRSMKKASLAHSDLQRAITILEKRRGDVEDQQLRDSFFDTAEETFEEATEVLLDMQKISHAFDIGERRRGRILLEIFGRSAGMPLTAMPLREIARRLPEDTSLLQINSLRGEALIFAVTSDQLVWTRQRISRAELQAICKRLRSAVENGKRDLVSAEAERVSAILLAPLYGLRKAPRRLIVVPDSTTSELPFALLNYADRRIISTLAVTVSPSASLYVHSLEQGHSRNISRVLVVGNPGPRSGSPTGRPFLSSARKEALDVAAYYPRAEILLGPDATIGRFTRELPAADIVHVAAHAVVNEREPGSSALLLSHDATSSGELTVERISQMKAKRGSTSILAACQTAVAGRGHGEIRNLAAAFLAAGASNVIATVWEVADEATHEFSKRLHSLLSRGVDVAAAVREVQLEMAASPSTELNDPRSWSGFQVYGNGL